MNSILKSSIFKRFGAPALATVFAMLVTGCGDNQPAEPSADEKKATEERIEPAGQVTTKIEGLKSEDTAEEPAK
uniref:Uncharacterized protein n=1 Tax=Candidatus Kentrum sp. SD TaxID=2126332 RepID=A0A451BLL4_9GAMM|nr:MAG: hypothetical protein BECKSD772F_GA0070984_11631 [Candidatus Kentron sp. SD]VFK49292.1 MAG: hypothetical protein BECKSD772E_GA0070983_11701 [Candidatus Kentron sp. SD]VFK79177.1 MAG: hypothetical protein BECKSD772D_GA0070982_103825 [Candidatus Kentron sp. SD]